MPETEPRRQWLGWSLTAAWLCAVLAALVLRRSELGALKLNELAELAAGGVAPLAFLWLVLGYFQQGRHLELQARELVHQVQETHRLAEAATQQVRFLESALRPRFVVPKALALGEETTPNGESQATASGELLNLGGRAEEVLIRGAGPHVLRIDHQGSFPSCEKDSRISFAILQGLGPEDQPQDLLIDYRDATGRWYEQWLRISMPRGLLELSAPEPSDGRRDRWPYRS